MAGVLNLLSFALHLKAIEKDLKLAGQRTAPHLPQSMADGLPYAFIELLRDRMAKGCLG